MAFHTAIWVDNYMQYVDFLSDLSTVSCNKDYNPVEWIDMHPGNEARVEALGETHCYYGGAYDDVNLFQYMGKQFAWGKRVHTYYKHPTEDFKDSKATKNSMGR
jgi:hypothetical protein